MSVLGSPRENLGQLGLLQKSPKRPSYGRSLVARSRQRQPDSRTRTIQSRPRNTVSATRRPTVSRTRIWRLYWQIANVVVNSLPAAQPIWSRLSRSVKYQIENRNYDAAASSASIDGGIVRAIVCIVAGRGRHEPDISNVAVF